jgi:pilus assembly protein CpaC
LHSNGKKINKIIPACLLCICACLTVQAKAPEIRGINFDPVAVQSNSKDFSPQKTNPRYNIPPQITSKDNASLDGSISALYGTVNKSQLIRFDEPASRISITNPELADLILLSPEEMLINGKSAGVTSLIIWGESKNPVFFDLVIKNDSRAFLEAVNKIAPEENINMEFNKDNLILTGKISSSIIKDKIKNLAEAYGFKVVDLAESPTDQVLIEVSVVEASKAFIKDLSATYSRGSLAANGATTLGLDEPDLTSNVNLRALDFDGTMNGFRFFGLNNRKDFTYTLQAAEQKGTVKILAQPKLLAANDKKANFNAGQEVPIPAGVGESGQVGYEYKKIGVNVSFKPTVLKDSRRVLLEITPEVSEIDSTASVQQQSGGTALGFKTRSIETTVDLSDGETLVIGGLYKKTNNETKTQIPILGDIPIIGRLFGNSNFRNDETELMIFVTPKIIEADKSTDRI